ncbi:KRAB-A domain-containing protein 2-like [Littorina saxatilis]|uniref:KRAB-A domain-containing protein 2-like n=1 Tax=Littorina saxatilis TaxID=31220 RepID=UPI0038B51F10
MESSPDGGFVHILNYQDHFTKFLVLRPLKSKRAAEVAYNFTMIGAPCILQSDNGREFVASVVDELKNMWQNLRIVHGRARHPQSQGSVERSNADVKQMLIAWTIDNGTSNWSEGLRFVQLQNNSSPHRNLQNKTPYEVLFGEKPRLGLQNTFLPKEVADVLTTEEELESAIREMTGTEEVDDEAMAMAVPEITGPEGVTDEAMAIPELIGAAEPVAQDVMAVDKEEDVATIEAPDVT